MVKKIVIFFIIVSTIFQIHNGVLQAQEKKFKSPIKLMAVLNRMSPLSSISDKELDLLSSRYQMIAGLDGHGYDFPGAIGKLRRRNKSMPVLCYSAAMDIIPANDPRVPDLDVDETGFFHSADPASFRALRINNDVQIWFLQDARGRKSHEHYTPPGVEYYLVEYALSENGPWQELERVPAKSTRHVIAELASYRVFDKSPAAGRWYRVRSKIGTKPDPVPYSWPSQAETVKEALPVAVVNPGKSFAIAYVGDSAPSAGEVSLEVDLDQDRIFGEENERFHASAVKYKNNVAIFYGTAPKNTRICYRGVVRSKKLKVPVEGSYTGQNTYNNRLQSRYGSHIIKPDSPQWQKVLSQRLADGLRAGYNGIRLDFTYDSVEIAWISNAAVSERERDEHDRIPASMMRLFDALKKEHPSALIDINGYFVFKDKSNYAKYLDHVDGADIEFFAYNLDSRKLLDTVFEAMRALFETSRRNKFVVAKSSVTADNVGGRITVLALYLLAFNDNTFYCNTTDGSDQSLPYFPEYDIPLGNPLRDISESKQLQQANGLLVREYENGLAVFNPTKQRIEIKTDFLRLGITTGFTVLFGVSGKLTYSNNNVVEPMQGALFIRDVSN